MVYHPFRHLGLKFLSVAVAVGLWFIVAGEQTVERSLRVALELTSPPEHLVQVEETPAFVDVQVRGREGLLGTLSAANVIAMVDLRTQSEGGPRYLYLTPGQVKVPFGVDVVGVTPSSLKLRFERAMTRTVPIEPVIEGEPASGYALGTVSVEPAEVELTGPESSVKRIRAVATEPVSVAGRRGDVRTPVTIGVSDRNIRLISSPTATVTVSIRPEPIDKRVAGVPVRPMNIGRGLSPSVAPASVLVFVRGPRNVVEGLGPAAVSAFVDLAGLNAGRYNRPVQVESAGEVAVVRIEPATVQVTIR